VPKKLILCLDGTSNRYCPDNTNVIKFLATLDKDVPNQLLYYQPGIGTIAPPEVFSRVGKWIITRLDLAFAILLKQHVQDAYRFLMRYYETTTGFSYSASAAARTPHASSQECCVRWDCWPGAMKNWCPSRGTCMPPRITMTKHADS
jgi:hypothetical protein